MWSSRRLPPQAFGNVEAVIRRRGFADFVELLRLHTRRKNSARLRRPGRPHQAPFRRRSARTFAGFRSPATGRYAPYDGRWCAQRLRAYPGPTQAPFLAYPASARRRGSTDGYSLTHEPPG